MIANVFLETKKYCNLITSSHSFIRNSFGISFFCFSFFLNANTSESEQIQVVTEQPQPFGTSTAAIFERPNEIYGIFQILQNLEFEQVPEASLTAPITSSNTPKTQRTAQQNRNISSNQSATNSTRNNQNSASISILENENRVLRKQNDLLNREIQKLQQNKTNSPQMNIVLDNLVTQFSEQRVTQEEAQRNELISQVSALKQTIAEQTKEIKTLTALPSNIDEKFTEQSKKLIQDKERLENENKTLALKIQETLKTAAKNIEDKQARITELEQELSRINELYQRDLEVANTLSQQLVSSEKPLTKEVEALNNELNITRKALEQEQYRSQQLAAQLTTLNNKFSQQVEQIQRDQSTTTANQSQELLSLRQRAQQSEIINQKFQQELLILENDLIQKQTLIDKLTVENNQISQQYSLQINELQQNLANARRAEAEANRWARTAGGGNPSVSSARLATLQQELEEMRKSEETQRALTTQKQQDIIVLQNKLAQLQSMLDSEQKSKKLLEDQIGQQKTTDIQSKTDNTKTPNKNTVSTNKATSPLSTSAGMKGINQ